MLLSSFHRDGRWSQYPSLKQGVKIALKAWTASRSGDTNARGCHQNIRSLLSILATSFEMPPPEPPLLKNDNLLSPSDSYTSTEFNGTAGDSSVMADPLVSALERVHLGSSNEADNWIDDILDLQRPRKRIKQDQEELKRELEEKFLTPSTSFSPEWLNKLQQYGFHHSLRGKIS